MMPALLTQLAAQAGSAEGLRENMRLVDLPAGWVLVLVLLPLVLFISALGYWRAPLGRPARVLLTSLRALALILVFIVLFRPVWVQRNDEVKQAEVLVLVDDSASMRRKDAYSGAAGSSAVLKALAGSSLGERTRLELAQAAYEQQIRPLLVEGDYRPSLYRFAEDLSPAPDLQALEARGNATHIGDALERALAQNRGRHLTDVVLISDGRSNGGESVLEVARAAGASGIPIHTLVVGDTQPERNLLVELLEVPADVLEGDEVVFSARVVGRGLAEAERARVLLEELDTNGEVLRLLEEQEVSPGPTGERLSLTAPSVPSLSGERERRFRLSVTPVPRETLLDDNALEFSVHITPAKIRVLYIDAYPRWEYRFLRELLKRADENIQGQMFLLSAESEFVQESSRELPPLEEVPTDRRELLENYDVIILGDVNPYAISPDPDRCEEFLASLREFVQRGGGLLMQAGEFDNPRSFVDTELEELLPIVLDATSGLDFAGDTTKEKRPRLEDPARPHQVLRLHPDPETNRALWEDEGGLKGFYWYSPVFRAKPGSQVLLRHPFEESGYGRHPLLVAGYFPAGRTLFMAFESTWRWRYRFGERYHGRFWRNAIRWLAIGRLKSGDNRSSLDSLRAGYSLDERVVIEARLLDEDFRPSESEKVRAKLQGPDGRPTDFELSLVSGRPGLFRSTFQVERPGLYRAWIEENGERNAFCEFEVSLPSLENQDPSPDPEQMASIASLSQGVALELGEIERLALQFPGGEERREPISARLIDAWDHWGTLLVILALLAIEWVLRKKWELV